MRTRLAVLILIYCVTADAQRALPLNRLAESRTTAGEYYRLPLALEDDYFDGHDSLERIRRHMRTAKDVGARYFRCAFSWNGIEPERGKYDWKFWDQLVAEANVSGIQMIPYVGYTPEWAARTKEEFWTQPPTDFNWYAEVLRAIVHRYKDRVHVWEIWNEPDLTEYWRGTAEEFVELVKIAAKAIRTEDPNSILVLGGMSKGPGAFYRRLHELRIEQYVDVIAMHAYAESWDAARAESIYYDRVQQMAKLINESGSGADLWLNEVGYADYRFTRNKASQYGTPVYFAYEHTRAYQAEYLFKSMTMALGSGKVSLFGWYRVDDFRHGDKRMPKDLVHYHLGLTDVNGNKKPAFYVFRNFARMFGVPVKRLQVRVMSSVGQRSTAMHEVFEDQRRQITVVAWLRSLEPDEARSTTGLSRDDRAERLTVALPCTSISNLRRFSATGSILFNAGLRFSSASLTGIRLRGDKVFIAQMQCERD
jgi:beta-xylosidase